jgi:hypothetical protein
MKNFKFLAVTLAVAAVAGDLYAQAANISRTDLVVSGTDITSGLNNAAGKSYIPNDGKTLVVIKNGNGSPVTATVKTKKSSLSKEGYGTVALSDETITVPSATTTIAGPFPVARWNTVSSTVEISMSTVAGVSMTSLRMPE